MNGYVVYRVYDRAGELLYIGCTGDLRKRLIAHERKQDWWPEAHEVHTSDRFDLRHEALDTERLAILAERPRYNAQRLAPSAWVQDGNTLRRRVLVSEVERDGAA